MKKRHRTLPSVLLCGAVALSLLPAGGAKSQEEVAARPDARSSVTVGAGQPTTLLTALAKFLRTSKLPKDRSLLVVDPAATAPVSPGVSPTDVSEGAEDSLESVARRFDRLVFTSGSVTALVPSKMVLLNPDPGAPDIYQGLSAANKMRLLMSALTPAQWQRLGSAGGLGADDLPEGERPLFLSLLPNPFCVRSIAVNQGAYQWQDSEARTLPAEARENIRLRLNLASEVRPVPSELGQGITLLGDSGDRQGTSFLTLDDAAQAEQSTGRAGWETYGVLMRAEVMNAQKPEDIDFDSPALATPVALKPAAASGGVLTIGEVVGRVGAASQRELYADRRIAALPVWTQGTTASAADLLRALCLGVTGTFRAVGPAFVLTDDVAGIGTRLAAQQDWLEEAKAQQEVMLESLQAHSVSKPLLASLSFPPDDPLSGDAATVKKVLDGYGRIYSGDYQVALATLPAARRPVFQKCIDSALKQEQPVRADVVAVNVNLRVAYLVPQQGEVVALQPDLGSLLGFVQPPAAEIVGAAVPDSVPLRPLSLAAVPNRVLCLAPKTDGEAVHSVDAAKAAGFQKLWIRLPPDGNTAPLVAAITRGKKSALAVSAVVPLFRQPAGLTEADQNVRGQTSAARQGQKLPLDTSPGDWRQVSSACLDDQKKRLTRVACLPGLAGMVLRDTAAPGYETPLTPHGGGLSLLNRSVSTASRDMGYTESLRLAFLRRYGLDPVDLTSPQPQESTRGSLPFFPADAQGAQQWTAFRGKINARHMAALFTALRRFSPSLPLLIAERSEAAAWFGSWDQPQTLPLYDTGAFSAPMLLQARSTSKQILKNIAETDERVDPQDYIQYIQSLVLAHGFEKLWDGAVFDLSALPIEKALQLTRSCFKDTVPHIP